MVANGFFGCRNARRDQSTLECQALKDMVVGDDRIVEIQPDEHQSRLWTGTAENEASSPLCAACTWPQIASAVSPKRARACSCSPASCRNRSGVPIRS